MESSYCTEHHGNVLYDNGENETPRNLPLLSYKDTRDAIIDNFIQEENTKSFAKKLEERYRKRQNYINRYYG